MKDKPSPEKTRSASESRFTKHFDNGKTRPAKLPDVPTNPDRSRTYLVLRAHQIGQATSKTTLKLPRGGAAKGSSLDQHSEEHWPGGLNKDDPRARENPREKGLGGKW